MSKYERENSEDHVENGRFYLYLPDMHLGLCSVDTLVDSRQGLRNGLQVRKPPDGLRLCKLSNTPEGGFDVCG